MATEGRHLNFVLGMEDQKNLMNFTTLGGSRKATILYYAYEITFTLYSVRYVLITKIFALDRYVQNTNFSSFSIGTLIYVATYF